MAMAAAGVDDIELAGHVQRHGLQRDAALAVADGGDEAFLVVRVEPCDDLCVALHGEFGDVDAGRLGVFA